MARIRLGELLLRAGFINEAQLEAALATCQAEGKRLGSTLIQLGFLDRETLVRALSKQGGIQAVGAEDLAAVTPEVAAMIPAHLAHRHEAIPIRVVKARHRNTLLVAFTEPELHIVDELAFAANCGILPCIAPQELIHEHLHRIYPIPVARQTQMVALSEEDLPVASMTDEQRLVWAHTWLRDHGVILEVHNEGCVMLVDNDAWSHIKLERRYLVEQVTAYVGRRFDATQQLTIRTLRGRNLLAHFARHGTARHGANALKPPGAQEGPKDPEFPLGLMPKLGATEDLPVDPALAAAAQAAATPPPAGPPGMIGPHSPMNGSAYRPAGAPAPGYPGASPYPQAAGGYPAAQNRPGYATPPTGIRASAPGAVVPSAPPGGAYGASAPHPPARPSASGSMPAAPRPAGWPSDSSRPHPANTAPTGAAPAGPTRRPAPSGAWGPRTTLGVRVTGVVQGRPAAPAGYPAGHEGHPPSNARTLEEALHSELEPRDDEIHDLFDVVIEEPVLADAASVSSSSGRPAARPASPAPKMAAEPSPSAPARPEASGPSAAGSVPNPEPALDGPVSIDWDSDDSVPASSDDLGWDQISAAALSAVAYDPSTSSPASTLDSGAVSEEEAASAFEPIIASELLDALEPKVRSPSSFERFPALDIEPPPATSPSTEASDVFSLLPSRSGSSDERPAVSVEPASSAPPSPSPHDKPTWDELGASSDAPPVETSSDEMPGWAAAIPSALDVPSAPPGLPDAVSTPPEPVANPSALEVPSALPGVSDAVSAPPEPAMAEPPASPEVAPSSVPEAPGPSSSEGAVPAIPPFGEAPPSGPSTPAADVSGSAVAPVEALAPASPSVASGEVTPSEPSTPAAHVSGSAVVSAEALAPASPSVASGEVTPSGPSMPAAHVSEPSPLAPPADEPASDSLSFNASPTSVGVPLAAPAPAPEGTFGNGPVPVASTPPSEPLQNAFPTAAAGPGPGSSNAPAPRAGSLETALSSIDAAGSADEVGTAVVDYLKNHFPCVLLLVVKNEVALGWKGHATGTDQQRIESLLFPLSMPSVLSGVAETQDPFLGPIPSDARTAEERLWRSLGCLAPREVAVSAVRLKGRVSNLLYVHSPPTMGLPPDVIGTLGQLADRAAARFLSLIKEARSRK